MSTTSRYAEEWKQVRLYNGYDNPMTGAREITHRTRDGEHDRLFFSNLTPYSPVFMYCPSLVPDKRHRMRKSQFDIPFTVGIHVRGEYAGRNGWWNADSWLKYFHFKRFQQGTYTARIGFLNAIGLRDRKYEILWMGVVPSYNAVEFHYRMLNMLSIDPVKLGLELWYNKEKLHRYPRFFQVFKGQLAEQIDALGLKAVGKTDEQMNSLLMESKSLVPKHRNIVEAKRWMADMYRIAVRPAPTERPTEGIGLLDQIQDVPGRRTEPINIELNVGMEGMLAMQEAIRQAGDQLLGIPGERLEIPRAFRVAEPRIEGMPGNPLIYGTAGEIDPSGNRSMEGIFMNMEGIRIARPPQDPTLFIAGIDPVS